MQQVNSWLGIQAQTELAHLTHTLPAADTYGALTAVIESKIGDAEPQSINIKERLQRRGVRLSSSGVMSADQSVNTTSSEGRPPVVVFLCDVEGTTTPLPFVRKVMRPLAAAYADTYVKAHFPSDAEFVQHVRDAVAYVASTAAAATSASTPEAAPPTTPPLCAAFEACEAHHFTDADANDALCGLFSEHFRQERARGSQEAYMKAVEGAIWVEVYAQGEHQTQVFPDVNEFFRFTGDPLENESWHVALYSTGSVEAQKLIMRHTPYGDLNPFITAYFDPTIVGTKLTPKSYMRIRNMLAEQLNLISPEQLQIVFITDNTSEASAADSSGAIDCPVLCLRPLNEWIKVDTMLSVPLPFITSFAQFLRPEEKVDYGQLVRDTMNALKDKEV